MSRRMHPDVLKVRWEAYPSDRKSASLTGTRVRSVRRFIQAASAARRVNSVSKTNSRNNHHTINMSLPKVPVLLAALALAASTPRGGATVLSFLDDTGLGLGVTAPGGEGVNSFLTPSPGNNAQVVGVAGSIYGSNVQINPSTDTSSAFIDITNHFSYGTAGGPTPDVTVAYSAPLPPPAPNASDLGVSAYGNNSVLNFAGTKSTLNMTADSTFANGYGDLAAAVYNDANGFQGTAGAAPGGSIVITFTATNGGAVNLASIDLASFSGSGDQNFGTITVSNGSGMFTLGTNDPLNQPQLELIAPSSGHNTVSLVDPNASDSLFNLNAATGSTVTLTINDTTEGLSAFSDIQFSESVPEPCSLVLAGSGALLAICRRRPVHIRQRLGMNA